MAGNETYRSLPESSKADVDNDDKEKKNSNRPSQIRLRLYYDFEKPRSGREVIIPACYTHVTKNETTDETELTLKASISSVQKAVSSQIDLTAHIPHVYDGEAECFVPLSSLYSKTETIIAESYTPSPTDNAYSRNLKQKQVKTLPAVTIPRIDIKLISSNNIGTKQSSSESVGDLASKLICNSSDTSLTSTWFGIGILRGKAVANHGTLWRSALQFGASLTFTIGKRYEKRIEGSADVYKTLRQVPCVPFMDVAAFMAMAPVDAKIVAIEYGGEDLVTFKHPKRALYVLGSEDAGVPPALVARAHAHVSIPTVNGRPASMNVASAGAVVMYDRMVKLGKDGGGVNLISNNENGESEIVEC